MPRRTLWLLPLLLALLAACPKRTTRALPDYQVGPETAFLGGQVIDLYQHKVLNRRDFIYSIAFTPDSALVAFPHMVMTDFELTLAEVDTGAVRWKVALNPTEFDVEGVDFVPPDKVVVAARRSATSSHPSLRLLSLGGGGERAVAFSDDERGYDQVVARASDGLIAAVTVKEGNVVLHDPSDLSWLGETRAHRGTATAVAFGPDGSLFTGGQDRTVARWRLVRVAPAHAGVARVAVLELGEGKDRAVLAAVEGGPSLILAVETGLETTAVTRTVADRLGLPLDGARRAVQTGAGPLTVPEVTLPSLRFKGLLTGPVPAVVCDECVPLGVDGSLGADLQPRLRVDFGPLPHVASVEVFEAASAPASTAPATEPAAPPVAAPASLYRLELVKRYVLPGPVNDLRISRDGATACVAISSEPAERTLQLYEREKAGDYPEPSPSNAAALLDLETGEVRAQFPGHRGFVVTADLSPDGRTLASGGWDNHVMLFDIASGERVKDLELSWLARRVRFSPDGRTLAVAAWTPPNAGGGDSEPSAILYDVVYETPTRTQR